MSKTVALIFGFLLAASSAQAQAPIAGPPSVVPTIETIRTRDLAAELRALSNWWPGVYDNHEQVVRQSGHGLMPLTDKPFKRIHIEVRAIADSPLGPKAFSLVERQGNDNAVTTRSEILAASVDLAENAIRVKRYRADDAGRTATAASYLGPACDLLLRYQGGQFMGGLATTKCAANGGFSEYQVIVGPKSVWERDQARNPAGRIVWEMAPGAGFDWHQATRAQVYSCDLFADAKGEMLNTKFIGKIQLDDQGGRADIPPFDGRKLQFTVHRRAFSIVTERDYPLFRVEEKGNPVPLAYAYATGEGEEFGLNVGWFYIRCDRISVADLK